MCRGLLGIPKSSRKDQVGSGFRLDFSDRFLNPDFSFLVFVFMVFDQSRTELFTLNRPETSNRWPAGLEELLGIGLVNILQLVLNH
jgi:hypothetical protein